MDESEDFDPTDEIEYRDPDSIEPFAIPMALGRLCLFDDPYLRSQATNLEIVDRFIMSLEYGLLAEMAKEDGTPSNTAFVGAQSQMWIMAAYELLRTWRERAAEMVKWAENGGLKLKLEAFAKDLGYQHYGRQYRAGQIERVIENPALIDHIKMDLKRTHIAFARLEAIRVSIAKHQVVGKAKMPALMPGYGRINRWCGSLDYEIENGMYIMGTISRRDIADEIRALLLDNQPPTDDEIASFDEFMRGPKENPFEGA